jgi:acyl carrier protein
LIKVTTQQHRVDNIVRAVLIDILGLSPARAAALDDESGLFGTLPELDSMAVANLLTELEDRLDVIIEDDELDGEMLESFGKLTRFLEAKVGK